MKSRTKPRTKTRIKPTRSPGRAEQHRAGTAELLSIAGKLDELTTKTAGKPTWRNWFFASAAVKDHGECLLRSFHEQLASGEYLGNGPIISRSKMVQVAVGVAAAREDTDPKDIKIMKETAAVMAKYGKKPDEDWPEGEAAPDDVRALWTEGWNRRAELTADVLRAVGEADLADTILADPDAFWEWYRTADALDSELLPEGTDGDKLLADLEKRHEAIWTDYFPKAGTPGLDK